MRPFSKASLATIVVSFLVSFGATVWTLRYEPLPDFGALSVVDKKQQFFAYLRPHIESANTLIRLCCKGCMRAITKDPAAVLAAVNTAWEKRRAAASPAHDHDRGHDHDHGGG